MRYLLLALIGFFFVQCDDKNNLSQAPEISFIGLSKDTIIQGRKLDDSLRIIISFRDGDGDIGDDNNEAALFLEDSRDGSITPFSVPMVPRQTTSSGVSGEMTILVTTLFNVCCYFDSGLDPCSVDVGQKFNELTYEIFLKDRAGNESNKTETSRIVLRCD